MVQAPPTTPTTPDLPLMCVSCGYALAGLADDGVCPECATSVERSIEARAGVFPSAARLRPAVRAVTLLLASMIGAAAVMLLGFGFPLVFLSLGGGLIWLALFWGCWALWCVGWYRLGTTDPTLPAERSPIRTNRALRYCSIAAALVPLAALVWLFSLPFPQSLPLLVTLNVGGPLFVPAQVILAAPVLSRLAVCPSRPEGYGRRVRDIWLARFAGVLGATWVCVSALTLGAMFAPSGALYVAFLCLTAAFLLFLGNLLAALVASRKAMRAALQRMALVESPVVTAP